jgi:hypothetical protein
VLENEPACTHAARSGAPTAAHHTLRT